MNIYLDSLLVVLLIVTPSSSIQAQDQTMTAGTVIYVDDDNTQGPWLGTIEYPYQFIQDAINVSTNGDTVYVFTGMYTHPIDLNKSISLLGENATILDGGYTGTIATVSADDVTIDHLTIQNAGSYSDDAGICITADRCTIQFSTISTTRVGIASITTNQTTIDNCSLVNNEQAVFCDMAYETNIIGSMMTKNAIGLHLLNSSMTTLEYCYLHNNGKAGRFNGSHSTTIYMCNISDNSANHGGLFLRNCTEFTIHECMITHNGVGCSIHQSTDLSVTNTTFRLNSLYAIWLDETVCDLLISRCSIVDNQRFGIFKPEESACLISENNIYGNVLYGLYSKRSHCQCPNNYWGSLLGPSYTIYGKGDRISFSPFRIHFRPWKLMLLTPCGASWQQNAEYMAKHYSLPQLIPPTFEDPDTDLDGVPDWWETKWGYDPESWDDHLHLDPDTDGLHNIQAVSYTHLTLPTN